MFEKLKALLSKVEADYADLRYEKESETSITFNGRELTQVGTNATDGFVLRVLKGGGFSSVTFTREDQAEWAIRTALENAGLLARHLPQPVSLAPVSALEDTFSPSLQEDPRRVPFDEKLDLTRHYNEIPYRSSGIVTTQTQYAEIIREKYFISSEGSRIREDLITTRLGGTITSREGTLTQTVRVGGGGSDGFARLRNQEGEFEEKTKIALDLLKAAPVEAGTYNVILNPDLTGVFTHEAFGHFSEADLIEDAPSMRERLTLGAALGSEQVSITDDPTPTRAVGVLPLRRRRGGRPAYPPIAPGGIGRPPAFPADRGGLRGAGERPLCGRRLPVSAYHPHGDHLPGAGEEVLSGAARRLGGRPVPAQCPGRTDQRRKFHLRGRIRASGPGRSDAGNGAGHQYFREPLSDPAADTLGR